MKGLIYAEKIIDFQITIKKLRYRSISLFSNIIYGLFIIEQSYKDQRWNVSTQFWYFYLSVILWTVLVINWSIHKTKHLFLLHLIYIYFIRKLSDYWSNSIRYYYFYNIIFVLWSTFHHHKEVSNRNRYFDYYFCIFCYLTTVWLN